MPYIMLLGMLPPQSQIRISQKFFIEIIAKLCQLGGWVTGGKEEGLHVRLTKREKVLYLKFIFRNFQNLLKTSWSLIFIPKYTVLREARKKQNKYGTSDTYCELKCKLSANNEDLTFIHPSMLSSSYPEKMETIQTE